ncbi:unnamed protein product [Schistosoma turkestanicum]|nr:unnamed protein product [Schistosoma turkestanicum]
MIDQNNPENMSYEYQMEKTLQKLHDVIQLRQQLLHERAVLKSQLDKLLQRSVNDVDATTIIDDHEHDGGVGDGDGDRDVDDDDVDDVDIDGRCNDYVISNNNDDDEKIHVNQDIEDSKSKEAVKQIRSKIKELERRCALQLLRHEEILLEIEDVRKRSCTNPSNNSTWISTAATSNSLKNQFNQLNDMYAMTTELSSSSSSCLMDMTNAKHLSNLSVNKLHNSTSTSNNKVHGRLLQQSGQQFRLKSKQDSTKSNDIDAMLIDQSSTLSAGELGKQCTNKQVKGRLFRSNTELQISGKNSLVFFSL